MRIAIKFITSATVSFKYMSLKRSGLSGEGEGREVRKKQTKTDWR